MFLASGSTLSSDRMAVSSILTVGALAGIDISLFGGGTSGGGADSTRTLTHEAYSLV